MFDCFLKRADFLRACARPPAASDFRERAGCSAVDHHLHVVKGRIRSAGRINALLVVDAMLGCIPSPDRDIESAGERDRIVHDDQLLMLRGAERHSVIQLEVHVRRRAPTEFKARQELAFRGVKEGEVPGEQIDLKLRPSLDQGAKKIAELRRQPVVGLAFLADKARLAVHVPAENEDTSLRLEERPPNCVEIRGGVDEHRGSRGAFDAPHIVAGPKNGLAPQVRVHDWKPLQRRVSAPPPEW